MTRHNLTISTRTYQIEIGEFTYEVEVDITAEDTSDNSSGPSESREFKIDSITDMDENGKGKMWSKPRRHPLYEDIHGEVELKVSEEDLDYEY